MEATQIVRPNVEVVLVADPQKMLDSAKKCADVLVKLVHERNLFKKFGAKEHLLVEAWQTVGHFYGVTGKIISVEDWTDEVTGEQGFKATAQAIHASTGAVISEAQAICLNNEDNWSTRPKYEGSGNERRKVGDVLVPRFQLMSMAQTRALSKVLRNVFAFVVVLAGFDPTPAEEMTGSEGNGGRGNGKTIEAASEGPKKITQPQRQRFFAIAHSKNMPIAQALEIAKKHGCPSAHEITVDKYDQIVKEIEAYHA